MMPRRKPSMLETGAVPRKHVLGGISSAWPALLLLGSSACGSGFEAVSVWPGTTSDDAQATVYIYGHGFEEGSTASVTWVNADGSPHSVPLNDVQLVDDGYTLKGTLPDLSGGQLPYPIYPYREFIANPTDVTPGLYTCDDTHSEVIWTPGRSDGYCDATGTPLALTPAQSGLIPPGDGESVIKYAGWYDALATCVAYMASPDALSEEQLQLLIPDYGLGCFYPDNPNDSGDGLQDGVPVTYAYCPVQTPAVEVNIVVNLPSGKQSVIERGLTLIDPTHDYYNSENYGQRVRGSFGAPTDVEVVDPAAVALEDLNEDGLWDVVVVNQASDTFSILWGPDFDPGEDGPASYSVGAGPVALAAADMDGDGHTDVVTANQTARTLTIAYGDGSGDFSSSETVTLDLEPTALGLGDLDGDGRVDIVVGSQTDAEIAVYLRQADMSFAPSAGSPFQNVAVSSLVMGDLDGTDGLDFLVSTSAVLYAYLNEGSASFVRVSAASPSTPGELAAAWVSVEDQLSRQVIDLDGDGLVDVATVHRDADPARNAVLLFKGELDQNSRYYLRFWTTLTQGLTDAPAAIALSDVNADAYSDREGWHNMDVVAIDDSGVASIYVNHEGEFGYLRHVDAAGGALAMASQDLDGDQDFDLALIRDDAGGGSAVTLLWNPSTIAEYLESTLNYCQ